tara:strand:+ start:95 stop:838 length:744 start_codon:yes stop_codon:yes gene_type:complete
MSLSGKNILITGSSRGLGFHLAKIYSEMGSKVYLNARCEKNLKNAKEKLNLDGSACDVTIPEECNRLIQECEKSIGSIDIIICNVGSGTSVETGSETIEEWKRVMDINFFSTVNVIDAAIKNSSSRKNVVCISSICGHEFIKGAPATYSVAKSALNFYVKVYSKYLESKQIKINGLICGNLMYEGSVWHRKTNSNKVAINNYLEEFDITRFGTPEDVSNSINFLVDESSSFVSGTSLILDGGQTKSL